jgi:hypothetical protein
MRKEPVEGRQARIWPIDELHRLRRFVEENISSSLSFRRQFSGPLITPSLGTGEDPKHPPDHKVRDEPAQVTRRDPRVNIRRFEQVSDEPVDRQSTLESATENTEVVEHFREREEPAPNPHPHFPSGSKDRFVRDVHARLPSAEDEDLLVAKLVTGLVLARMDPGWRLDRLGSVIQAGDDGDVGQHVQTSGDHHALACEVDVILTFRERAIVQHPPEHHVVSVSIHDTFRGYLRERDHLETEVDVRPERERRGVRAEVLDKVWERRVVGAVQGVSTG